MSAGERVVIVGAGLAGLRAAERLRELNFDGEIVLIGSEEHKPYHRPALSKQFLQGAMTQADLEISTYDSLDVIWRLGTTVTHLQPRRRIVHLPGAEEMRYDGLIIATGVDPRRLSDGQHGHPRVVSMRRVSDSVALQRNLASNKGPVVVIGSGFTGCEIASTLVSLNREVILVVRGKTLMGKVLGPELAGEITELHRENGVELALGATVTKWALGGSSVGVRLSNGDAIAACCVVVAVGSVPSVTWLRGSGIPIRDGVVCGPTCHVEGVEDVVAAGDVAQWPNLRYDTEARRVEHWINATEMGRVAAQNLLAGRATAVPFMPIPRFWSEQHGSRIQAAGMPVLGTERRTLGADSGPGRSVTGYFRDGQLMGVAGLNSPSAFLHYAESLNAQDPETYHDVDSRPSNVRQALKVVGR
ncbi:NAD(P)/FAD-dependent oxidoreductase [Lentzea sp. NPDC051213]|uniref:NAD(P)/FAD-dependent oxidoreductase n=1 Tax=Lentzea sp. NPDC051213 TaxID=3364126 RepID=UPI0037A06FB7